MRKTLPTMAKATLAFLLAWGGTAQGGAQATQSYKRNLVDLVDYGTKEDYHSGNKSTDESANNYPTDWKNNDGCSMSILGWYIGGSLTDYVGGNNGNPYVQITASENGTYTAYRPVAFAYEAGSGFTDKAMGTAGYVVEFDFAIYGNNSESTATGLTQLSVATTDDLPTTGNYTGDDYVFDLTQSNTTYTSSLGKFRSRTTWNVNRVTTTDVYLDNEQDGGKWQWYHLNLVVTAGSATYTITRGADGATIDSGTKDLSGQVVPTVKAIWVAIANPGIVTASYLKFDNFEVYDYVADASYQTAEAPAITWKETAADGLGSVYTISFNEGETLYYQLPGQTDWTAVTSGTAVDVDVTAAGTLSAYTTYVNTKGETSKTTTSATQTEAILSASISTNAASYLGSFSSAHSVRVPDGVGIYVVNYTSDEEMALQALQNGFTLTKIKTNIIPSSAGVFLYREGGGTVILPHVGEEEDETGGVVDQAREAYYGKNRLAGTGEIKMSVTDIYSNTNSYCFCLKKDTKQVAMVSQNASVPAHKAYLKIPATVVKKLSGGAKLDLIFDDGDATGIDGVKVEEESMGGQDALYNLAGQRVDESYKGIVVRNGRKYLKK